MANLYRQDFPVPGFTSQAIAVYNRNREDDDRSTTTTASRRARPRSGSRELRNYDVGYFGLNGDGHFGRINLTASGYCAIGQRRATRRLTGETADIQAFFAAAELSIDFDWMRAAAVAACTRAATTIRSTTADDRLRCDLREPAVRRRRHQLLDPPGGAADRRRQCRAVGPQRRACRPAFVEGARASRTSSIPGLMLLGIGADFDVLPELRLSLNANYLRFDDTAVLEVAAPAGEHRPTDRLGPVGGR